MTQKEHHLSEAANHLIARIRTAAVGPWSPEPKDALQFYNLFLSKEVLDLVRDEPRSSTEAEIAEAIHRSLSRIPREIFGVISALEKLSDAAQEPENEGMHLTRAKVLGVMNSAYYDGEMQIDEDRVFSGDGLVLFFREAAQEVGKPHSGAHQNPITPVLVKLLAGMHSASGVLHALTALMTDDDISKAPNRPGAR